MYWMKINGKLYAVHFIIYCFLQKILSFQVSFFSIKTDLEV